MESTCLPGYIQLSDLVAADLSRVDSQLSRRLCLRGLVAAHWLCVLREGLLGSTERFCCDPGCGVQRH